MAGQLWLRSVGKHSSPTCLAPSLHGLPSFYFATADPDIASQVVANMPPLEQWRRFVYCTGMAGEVMGVVDHFK